MASTTSHLRVRRSKWWIESVACWRKSGAPYRPGIASVSYNRALAYRDDGRPQEALADAEQALRDLEAARAAAR